MPGQLLHQLDDAIPAYNPPTNHLLRRRLSVHYNSDKWNIVILEKLLKSSLPPLALFIPQSLTNLITLYYIGCTQNSDEFIAIGLALALNNIFTTRVIIACTTTLQALIKQALKLQKYHQISGFYQRGIILMTISLIISQTVMFLGTLLVDHVGESTQFTKTFRYFTIALIPYNIFNLFFYVMKALFLSYDSTFVITTATWLKLFYFIFLNTFLSKALISNLFALVLSKCVAEITIALSLYMYIKTKNRFIQAQACRWSIHSFHRLVKFISFFVQRGLPIYLDRILLDILIVLIVLTCPPEMTAAHISLSAYFAFMLAIPYSLCLSTSKYIKSALEQGSEVMARNYLSVGIMACLFFCLVSTLINAIFTNPISRIFSDSVEFHSKFRKLLTFHYAELWCGTLFAMLSIIYRNFLKRNLVLKHFVLSNVLVSLPLAILMGLAFNWQAYGIMGARIISQVSLIVLLGVKLALLDWWEQVRKTYFWLQKNHFEEVYLEI